jgi:hypothetical protein
MEKGVVRMKTIILPGFSLHNKDWAEEMAGQLKLGHEIIVHNWRHWINGGGLALNYEIDKILQEIGNEKINILAKSVGVYVCLNLIPKIVADVEKVILCGIASIAGEDRKAFVESMTARIPVDNILCIQNENDKYVKFSDAEKFYHSVEPKLKVISKPRSDHDYPYPEDFKVFLSQ